ncbi:MAG: hypothetical protein KGQ84_07885 [Proteobacteria bacterium]|nr:hypothetical protein [Pseudomonadota bacterium]
MGTNATRPLRHFHARQHRPALRSARLTRSHACARRVTALQYGARLGGTMMRAMLVACLLCLSLAAFAGQPDAYSAGMAAHQAHDYQVALADFRLAAKQGDAKAECDHGVMYDQGQGVPQDYAKAYKWTALALAASKPRSNVHGMASTNMRRLEAMMTPTQIAQGQQEASAWWAAHHEGSH